MRETKKDMKHKENSKMVERNPIMNKENGLNISIKRQRLSDWVFKTSKIQLYTLNNKHTFFFFLRRNIL